MSNFSSVVQSMGREELISLVVVQFCAIDVSKYNIKLSIESSLGIMQILNNI